ncbi:GNAT family N-acetyltransferase [Virgibacillus sp. 179-BFC.A HS]|uniref:GNAT family N-acetyltransferase n=1 Tax=Tigheibacillus jepli TaxID=3035914 RepID=A0ABU5CGD3_9BACI|nr:GNAT family N-acetyltransferase [Virgibacillus sp. 179-BFC.A HS]MDY0405381.1 GNAT family N-acetyltransferase [Virgibacillus sp. 179-BFC.A HS]
MLIRKAAQKDAPGIAKVHVDSWRTTYKGIVPDTYLYESITYEARTKAWEEILKIQTVFVAVDDQQNIIGFANGGKERSGKYPAYDGELYAIYLLAVFQRKGIGRKLMEAVKQYLIDEGFHSMLIWVLAENKSKYFYEKMGGEYVDAEKIQIGGKELEEIAYGWENLSD